MFSSPVFQLFMGFVGGITFLLYGLRLMSNSVQALAGESLQKTFSSFTKNRVMGMLTGALCSVGLQSSTATAVMSVGFVAAGMMTLQKGLAIILGADLGTILTIQLIAFKVNELALLVLGAGFAYRQFAKSETHRQMGKAVMGLGFLFFGLYLMGKEAGYVEQIPFLSNLFLQANVPLWGLLIGIILTVLLQSSTATLAIAMGLASQGLIGVTGIIFLTLGANIGTTSTTVITGMHKNTDGRRAACAHLLFKVGGLVLMMPLIGLLIYSIEALNLSPLRQVAHVHLFMNVLIVLVFLPFLPLMEKFLRWAVPYKPSTEETANAPVFLEDSLLEHPTLARNAAKREAMRIAEQVEKMLKNVLTITMLHSRAHIRDYAKQDDFNNAIYQNIVAYVGKAGRVPMDLSEADKFTHILGMISSLEEMGDILSEDFVKIALRRHLRNVQISTQTQKVLLGIHQRVLDGFSIVYEALAEENAEQLQQVIDGKYALRARLREAREHQGERLSAEEGNRMSSYIVEMEILDNLERVAYHTRKIARHVLALQ